MKLLVVEDEIRQQELVTRSLSDTGHEEVQSQMKKELEKKLLDRWPSWFNVLGDPRETRMGDGFAHGDGWFGIVWRLCEDLEPLAREAERTTGRPFEVLQVKEKFAGLRFYVNHRTDAIQNRIEAAEVESFHTCEVCGQPGRHREGDWIRTVCDKHASAGEGELACKPARRRFVCRINEDSV